MEPFEDNQGLEEYRRRLGLKHAVSNSNGKIWGFIDEIMEYEVVRDEDQMLTLRIHSLGMGIEVLISLVYAKCTQGERLQLWESMADIANTVNLPWIVGGDFNVISNEEEKLGGL